jgi:hypothetical protein
MVLRSLLLGMGHGFIIVVFNRESLFRLPLFRTERKAKRRCTADRWKETTARLLLRLWL